MARAAIVAIACSTIMAAPARAQSGPGTSGAQVLQLLAGSRAAALSGAYAAATGDPDILFYNPAGLASLQAGAALAYQRYVEDISLGSAAGVMRMGPVSLAAGVVYMDAGEIDVLEPDPDFGGQRGRPTGQSAGASESAARLGAALPLFGGRLSVGASAGLISSDLAGSSRSAAVFDLGAQAVVMPRLTIGAALRNVGGSLSGSGLADAPLPTEARVGAAIELSPSPGLGVIVVGDAMSNLEEGTTSLATGIEAGLMPGANRRLGAVARLGYGGDGAGEGGLGALRFGAGLSLGALAVDYTYQNLDIFGAVHRFGVRWARPRP